jgi:hypothetical protein
MYPFMARNRKADLEVRQRWTTLSDKLIEATSHPAPHLSAKRDFRPKAGRQYNEWPVYCGSQIIDQSGTRAHHG